MGDFRGFLGAPPAHHGRTSHLATKSHSAANATFSTAQAVTTTTYCGSVRDKTDETTDNRKIMANSSPAPSRGRPVDPNSTSGKIRTLLASGMSQADIVKKLGCAQSLVYSVKARMEGGGKPRKSGRGPGRPPKAQAKAKAAPKGSMDGLSGILEMVKRNEAERTRLLGALEKVAAAVREALA